MTFKPNPRFADEMGRDPQVVRVLEEYAEEAAQFAQAIARDHRDTGALEESYGTDGTALTCTDFAWHIIEFGGGNTPPIAPMRKAVEQTGARYKDTRG